MNLQRFEPDATRKQLRLVVYTCTCTCKPIIVTCYDTDVANVPTVRTVLFCLQGRLL